MDKIIEHQAKLALQDTGIRRNELSDLEYLKIKYQIALQILAEMA